MTNPVFTACCEKTRNFYLAWLHRRFRDFTLAGLIEDDQPIALKDIYVPLRLHDQAVSEESINDDELAKTGEEVVRWLTRHDRLVLSGLPGSGKTTLVSAILSQISGPDPDPYTAACAQVVPVPIILRNYKELAGFKTFEDLLAAWWMEAAAGVRKEFDEPFEPDLLTPYFDAGMGLFIVDGLDEVGAKAQRKKILTWLTTHKLFETPIQKDNPSPSTLCRLLLTGRPSGFEGLDPKQLAQWKSVFVVPFNREQARTFVNRWYDLRSAWVPNKAERVAHFFAAIDRMQSTQSRLIRRPAFLTLMAFIHGTRGELPYTRAELYRVITDAYLHLLDQQRDLLKNQLKQEFPPWTSQEKRDILAALAHDSQIGGSAAAGKLKNWERERADRRLQWSRADMESHFRKEIEKNQVAYPVARPEHAKTLTDYYLARTGLLVTTDEGLIQFGHLSFQEYLAAVYLLSEASSGDKVDYLRKHLFNRLAEPGWEEVALLLLAIDATQTKGKGHRAILGALDLSDKNQLGLLVAVLAGRELPMTAAERQAWLALACLACVVGDHPALGERLGALDENKDPGLILVTDAVVAWSNGQDPAAQLAGVARELAVAAQLTSHFDEGFKTIKTTEESPWDRSTTALLSLAAQAQWWHQNFEDHLSQCVPDRGRLFGGGEQAIQATPLYWALNSALRREGKLSNALAERTPLGLFLIDEGSFTPAISYVLFAPPGGGGGQLITWNIQLESALNALAMTENSVLALARARDLARARARARDLARARARDLALDLDLARARARDLALDLDLDLDLARARARDLALDLDLARARDLARDLALDLDLDLARARARDLALALDRNLALYRARDLARALDLDLALDRALDQEWLKESGIVERTISFLIYVSSYPIIEKQTPVVSRADISEIRATLVEPDAVARLFPHHLREQARGDWEWVLAQPWSPVRTADALLEVMPESIDLRPEVVLPPFETFLDNWNLEAEKQLDRQKSKKSRKKK